MTSMYQPPDDPRRVRGALRTTPEDVARLLRERYPTPLTMNFGGVKHWPVQQYLNKFLFITGVPGVGKTTFELQLLRDQANFFELDNFNIRWLVVDPTGAYGPFLHQVVPPTIPIWFLDPAEVRGLAWDVATDMGIDELIAEAIAEAILPASLSRGADPFWVTKAKELVLACLRLFIDRRSRWVLADLARLFEHPEFIPPVLAQSPRTRGTPKHTLVGEMGAGVLAVASGEVKKLSYIAAAMEHADRTFTLSGPDGFLNQKVVAHMGYDPSSMRAMSLYAGVLTEVMSLHAFRRRDEHNHTVIWADEGRYMSGLPIEAINARGRQSGLSCVLSSVGIPALLSTWKSDRVDELLDGVFSWVAFSCGHRTAKAFCDLVGEVAQLEESRGKTENKTWNWGRSWSEGWGNVPAPGASFGYGTSSSTSSTFSLQVRQALLTSEVTNLPQGNTRDDLLEFFLFSRGVGLYHAKTPFLNVYRNLPPAPPEPVRRPAEEFKLRLFDTSDVDRLNLELTDALKDVLRAQEGVN